MSLEPILNTLRTSVGPLRCVELGKIKIGGLGERRKTCNGNEWRMPRKDDFFTITGVARDRNGDLIQDTALMASLLTEYGSPDGKLRQLPVRLLSNEIDQVLIARYCWYGRKTIGAFSDGQTVTWHYDPKTMAPIVPPRVEEWNPAMLDMVDAKGNKLFKLHSNFSCTIHSQDGRWGGVYLFRSTSVISFRQLYASLLEISDKTGGVLIGMPLMLCVRPMQVAPEGKATTVFVVHLEIRGADIQDLQRLAIAQAEFRLKFQSSIQRIERQYQKMLTAPGDESPDEAAEIAAEFAPEYMADEHSDEESGEPQLSATETLAADLKAEMAQKAGTSTPVGVKDTVGTFPEGESLTLEQWTTRVNDATTIEAVRDVVAACQLEAVDSETLQSVLKLCLHREEKLSKPTNAAKVAELAKQLQNADPAGTHGTASQVLQQPAPQPEPPKPFPWKTASQDERTAYTITRVKAADLEGVAQIAKSVTESMIGPANYRLLQQAMTAREAELRPADNADADPFASTDEPIPIQTLRELLKDADTAAKVDEIAATLEGSKASMENGVYVACVEILAAARNKFQ